MACLLGAIIAKLQWIVCPIAAYIFWHRGIRGTATLALLWPLVIIVMPKGTWGPIGGIQKMFMQHLGYEPANRV
jgi:hypothetical protein